MRHFTHTYVLVYIEAQAATMIAATSTTFMGVHLICCFIVNENESYLAAIKVLFAMSFVARNGTP